ncbi:MAG: ATP-binding cassette domain-containing protein [Planctomycetaceae bacterium]|nr:ATP-binding cassette domain-containing protein [Planctomycetaceae bacterium]
MHNLRNLDIDIPRDKLVVITGPSGSGKSSLAFDTIFAEGQRQYIETMSVYARQFLGQLPRPDVEWLDGLQPTLCIDQKPGSASPRSTVGTVTEIYDYLRLLFARAGVLHCGGCGRPIKQQTSHEIAERILGLPKQTKLVLMAPMVRGRKGAHAEVIEKIRKAGLVRARVDGEMCDIDAIPKLAVRQEHTISAVVDRLVIREGIDSRLQESLQLALKLGQGVVLTEHQHPSTPRANSVGSSDQGLEGGWQETLYSVHSACPDCGISYGELSPRNFSFNSPYGACPECNGLGATEAKEPAGTKKKSSTRNVSEEPIVESAKAFVECQSCSGSRVNSLARQVQLRGVTIDEIVNWDIAKARVFFEELLLDPELTGVERRVAEPSVREIIHRLKFLQEVAVEYLTLGRSAATLSGGEFQRVRLATAIGIGLTHVCFVLDEPSIGLHQRDNQLLIQALRRLQNEGNSVLVVEHDEEVMRAADWIIDMGPGAGAAGGELVVAGPPNLVMKHPLSTTARYLNGRTKVQRATQLRDVAGAKWLELVGATLHNLKNVDLRLPLGRLICVTGVSGSGKSSLIYETLGAAIQRHLGSPTVVPGPYKSLSGLEHVQQIVRVDQASIGRSPRSNAATYTGIFDDIRRVFAATKLAKQLGFSTSRFSFNSKAGRCPQCEGLGQQRIEMKFLPDLFVNCPLCRGARFHSQTLRVKFRDLTIAQVLELSCEQARDIFAPIEKIHRVLAALCDVGLEYLPLGQASTTLSGGEAQRIKLATYLARPGDAHALFLLDEPTTGLHFGDIQKLLNVLDLLVEKGHSVVVVEHNLDLIRNADWVIDVGPGGGRHGGRIVAAGPPSVIKQTPESVTGGFL